MKHLYTGPTASSFSKATSGSKAPASQSPQSYDSIYDIYDIYERNTEIQYESIWCSRSSPALVLTPSSEVGQVNGFSQKTQMWPESICWQLQVLTVHILWRPVTASFKVEEVLRNWYLSVPLNVAVNGLPNTLKTEASTMSCWLLALPAALVCSRRNFSGVKLKKLDSFKKRTVCGPIWCNSSENTVTTFKYIHAQLYLVPFRFGSGSCDHGVQSWCFQGFWPRFIPHFSSKPQSAKPQFPLTLGCIKSDK